MKRIIGSIGLFVGIVACCSTLWAQNQAAPAAAGGQGGEHVTQGGGAGGPGGGPGGGGRGNWSPEQFRQRMMDHMKEQLKATDEEWTVIKPLLDKVMQARDAGRGRMMRGMMGGRRGPDNNQPQANTPATPGQAETDALRAALDDANTPADAIKAKLAAVRDAHAKSEEDLKKAREALRGVLTQRQEAELVLMGMMD